MKKSGKRPNHKPKQRQNIKGAKSRKSDSRKSINSRNRADKTETKYKKYNLGSQYDLEIEKVVNKIKKSKAKLVCIQLPDGLKPLATKIADILKENTKSDIIIWSGSCFGACDIPDLRSAKVDLLVQWGHSSDLKTYKDI